MLFSYNWTQKYFKEKLPTPEKLSEGIIFHSFEIEGMEKLPPLSSSDSSPQAVEQDTIFDVDILPNRAHDCLSYYGFAKEIAVIFGLEIKPEMRLEIDSPKDSPLGQRTVLWGGSDSSLVIQNESEICRRYLGRIVKNIKVGPSPDWLRVSLESIRQKSINNIVDATNYVMYDLGNPIHAFDLNKLDSPKIIIRQANKGEKLTTLDKKDVELDESILIIADEAEPLAIAGVKGGDKAEIDDSTKNIIIEVANFDPVAVRKTAKKLNIFTDSSKRFENEISPELAGVVMDRISNLILEVAGGDLEDPVESYKDESYKEKRKINFSGDYVRKLLGLKITDKEIEKILNRYEYTFSHQSDWWEVEVPMLRLDITGHQDMVEEIGRMYGYNKITPELPKIAFNQKDDLVWKQMIEARNILVNMGYKEVMNYTFVEKGEVEIMAGASDKSFLRTNLSDGVKKSYELNLKNLPLLGDDEIKIFEIGNVFKKDSEEINVCWMDKKEIQEMSLEYFIEEKVEFLREKVLPLESPRQGLEEQKDFNYFRPWSVFPFITRDIAVWTPASAEGYGEASPMEQLVKIYKEFGTELLVCEPKLFDKFTKPASPNTSQGGPAKSEGEEAKTSYAFRLVFQSTDRTLTDDEINGIMGHIEEKVSSLGWVVR